MSLINLVSHLKAPSAPYVSNGVTIATSWTRTPAADLAKLDFDDILQAGLSARFTDGTERAIAYSDSNTFGFAKANSPIIEHLTNNRSWAVSIGIVGTVSGLEPFYNGANSGPTKYTMPVDGYLHAVSVNWETAPSVQYSIQYSIDGQPWVDIQAAAIAANTENIALAPNSPIKVSKNSYIQLRSTQPGFSVNASLLISTWY